MSIFRPSTFDEIIGLKDIKCKLKYDLLGARQRGVMPPHYLITGSPGVGKTTIAEIISKVTNGQTHKTIAAELNTPAKLHALAASCKDGDVVFIDEAHRLTDSVITILLPWMEESKIFGHANFVNNQGPKVSFILPTTNAGQLHKALINRCNKLHINPYSSDEIKEIVKQAAVKSGVPAEKIDEGALLSLARSSRGIPRTALEQRLGPLLNIMAVDGLDFGPKAVSILFKVNHIHPSGLEAADLAYCKALSEQMNKNMGRPVSHKTMCQITQMEPDVVTNMIESFLVQEGIINIISKGRTLTEYGSNLLNLKTKIANDNQTQMSLYDSEEEQEEIYIMPTTNKSTEAVAALSEKLNFEEIEKSIKAGSFKLQVFATTNNYKPNELREALVTHFGSKIGFFRGKNGGVRWVESTNADSAVVSNVSDQSSN